MSDSARNLNDAAREQILAQINQSGASMSREQLASLEELIDQLGGVHAAKQLFDAMAEEKKAA